MRDVVPTIELGGLVVAPSSSSLAPALQVGGGFATATVTVFDAVDSGRKPEGVSQAPVVPWIGVEPVSQARGAGDPGADAADASSGPSIDVPGVLSVSLGLPSIVPGVGDVVTGLLGTVGTVSDSLDGVVAGVPGGGGAKGGAGAISFGGGPELGGAGISISDAGISSTIPGLSVGAGLSLLPSLDPTGGPEAPVLPALPTISDLSGGSAVDSTSSLSEKGSNANPPFAQEGPGANNLPGAIHATSAGSTPGNPAGGVGHASEAQAVSFAPNAGSVAIETAAGRIATDRAASATSGSSASATTSDPAGRVGNEAGTGRHRLRDPAGPAGPSSLEPGRPAEPEIAPAELLPGDLEALERALGQLMRRFDEMGGDLAGRLAQFGTLEMLLSAALVVLACEGVRRWERQRQLANLRARIGSSRLPGPFYRPRGCPFGRTGPGALAGGTVLH